MRFFLYKLTLAMNSMNTVIGGNPVTNINSIQKNFEQNLYQELKQKNLDNKRTFIL